MNLTLEHSQDDSPSYEIRLGERCEHRSVTVVCLETTEQCLDLKTGKWTSPAEVVYSDGLVEATCDDCEEDVTMQVVEKTGLKLL